MKKLFPITLLLSGVILLIAAQSSPATTAAYLTATPTPDVASIVVETNADWTPIVQEFDGVEMVLVPAGCFMMGNDENPTQYDGQPAHEQCFDEPFWIDRYEVSNAQFDAFGGKSQNNGRSYNDQPDTPREMIFFFEVVPYCESRGGRLPTEREWEYAARGPDGLLYPWGNEYDPESDLANIGTNRTAAIGSYPEDVSWVGAFDMGGNVREFVSSALLPYPYDPEDGREIVSQDDPGYENDRVTRGGTATIAESYGIHRLSARLDFADNQGNSGLGFRCAHDFSEGNLD